MNTLKEINGRYYMPAKVVMLSTDKDATTKPFSVGITLCNDGKLRIGNPVGKSEIRKELYFISNEEIKKGFSGFAIVTVKDDTRIKYLVEVIVTEDNQCYCKEDRKFSFEYYQINPIIATTDDSLGLHKPSSSFIKAYIEEYNKGNIITDVLVEYYVDYKIHCEISREDCSKICGKSIGCELCSKANWKLKVDSNNTITTKKIKDSWNYEEHCLDMQYYMEYCERSGYVTPQEWINKYKHY